jgi:uncharacterized protein (DUF2141 family)
MASSFSLEKNHSTNSNGQVVVTVDNIRSIKGQVGLCLFNSANGFPGDAGKAVMRGFVKVSGHSVQYTFVNVSPGIYAISAFHDENEDQKISTNFLGIPKEGVGVSNNAKGFLGPPKFEDAKFTFPGGRMAIKIDMAYL